MNCPHCGQQIETKKSLRKRLATLEAEVQALRLQRLQQPIVWPLVTPVVPMPQPEPYWPQTYPGTSDPFGLHPSWTICNSNREN